MTQKNLYLSGCGESDEGRDLKKCKCGKGVDHESDKWVEHESGEWVKLKSGEWGEHESGQ